MLDDRTKQLSLAAEVVVHHPFRKAGISGDAIDPRAVEARCGKMISRRANEPLTDEILHLCETHS